jgi:hypothetical protein
MSDPPCGVCGQSHAGGPDALCPSMRVPLRVYGGYLEARAALRANAPAAAIRVLRWLLSHIAEERGAPADRPFKAKLKKLTDDDVISERVEAALFDQALSTEVGPEQAWALMSIAEHAFQRLYLRQ